MAEYKTNDTELGSIASAIRTKGGTTASLVYPQDFVSAINAISTGGGGGSTPNLQAKTVTSSTATQTIRPDTPYDGLSKVTVNAYTTTSKTVTSSTATQTVTPGSGYNALSQVVVNAIGTGSVTPIASKGTVSNHQISITPKATVTAGYVSAGTPSGTAVTVSASELVSGTMTVTTNSTYDVKNYASMVVNVAGGGEAWHIGTATTTNSSATATSITFTNLNGAPKAFWVRCTSTLSRSSSYRYYYVATMRYNGTNTNGNRWYMYNGQFSNITSGYSYTYSGTTLTLSSSGQQSTSPGSFYNGTYELLYIY